MNRGWVWTQLLAFDRACAALLFNRPDVTLSALCGLYRMNAPTLPKFNAPQRAFLAGVGNALEFFWPGHCMHAMKTDVETAKSTILMIEPT